MRRRARDWIQRFLALEAASGIVLGIATVLALAIASSPWAEAYTALLTTPIGRIGAHALTAHWIVDDVLMTLFFFVVGLEIRRELTIGALSDRKRAALPAIAALGGMAVPACLYLLAAGGSETRRGWGIPTATDIAFAVGVLSLLGRRVPASLRVLLLALAVIDDLGAIVVIAVFYTRGIAIEGLVLTALGGAVVLGMRRARVQSWLAYAAPALAVWVGCFVAGIHPTIAGVALGMLVPLAQSEQWSERLHPWVAYGVMPLFALANAGVPLGAVRIAGAEGAVMLGIAVGLVLGKPLGIGLASALAIRAGIAAAPEGLTRRHLLVLGLVGGIGFTMAIFVSGLAFDDATLRTAARTSVLAASTIAAVLGLAAGAVLLPATSRDRG